MLFSTCFLSALWAGTALQTETSGVCFVARMGKKKKKKQRQSISIIQGCHSENWVMFPSPFFPATAEVSIVTSPRQISTAMSSSIQPQKPLQRYVNHRHLLHIILPNSF